VEAVIEGGAISEGLIAQALDTLRQDIAPIDDVRGSAWYRRHLACTYLEQELRRVAQA
jgi:CO/xanthine dehydrogenase FAD-binding subunit